MALFDQRECLFPYLFSEPNQDNYRVFKGQNCNCLFLFFFHRDEFNIKVLQAFVELHEFADLNLVQALR